MLSAAPRGIYPLFFQLLTFDLLIPRGSNSFVQYIMNHTKIPVMGHADGVCHIYVDKEYDKKKAIPVIVDAGIGRPSQACEAMEMGADAVMANTAIATAGDVPMMAEAFKKAIEAGRNAYLSGLGRTMERGGSASSPLTGFLQD